MRDARPNLDVIYVFQLNKIYPQLAVFAEGQGPLAADVLHQGMISQQFCWLPNHAVKVTTSTYYLPQEKTMHDWPAILLIANSGGESNSLELLPPARLDNAWLANNFVDCQIMRWK